MIKFCITCESLIINNECSNNNCPDKLKIIEKEVNRISEEFFENGSSGFICTKSGCFEIDNTKKDS